MTCAFLSCKFLLVFLCSIVYDGEISYIGRYRSVPDRKTQLMWLKKGVRRYEKPSNLGGSGRAVHGFRTGVCGERAGETGTQPGGPRGPAAGRQDRSAHRKSLEGARRQVRAAGR